MRGLNEAEVNAKATQLAELAMRAVQQAPPTAPPPSPSQAFVPPGADEYVTGAQIQQYGQQVLQQAQGIANPAVEMAAQGNLEMVKGQYQKEFAKYGPDIYGLLSRVPKTEWSIDNLKRVVKLALVDRIDDLVNDRVVQLQTSQDPALRSTGAGASSLPSLQAPPDGALTDAMKETLRRRGITEATVQEFASKKGWTPQQWYEKAGKFGIGDGA